MPYNCHDCKVEVNDKTGDPNKCSYAGAICHNCRTWGPKFGDGDNGWYEEDACGGCKGRLLDGRFKAADTSPHAKGKDLKALAEEMKGKLAPKSSAAQAGAGAVPAQGVANLSLDPAAPARVRNRWGDGLEAPAAGMRPFFPSGWTPTKTVGDAVKVFGQSDEEVQQLLTDAKRNAAKLKLLDISLSDKLVAAVLAYTKERPNLYADLNEACRTPGGHWERLLEHYRDYLYHLDRAVQALPNFSGETYRGIQTVGLGHAYREGATITWQQFSSASKVLLVAIQFLHLRVGSSAQLSGSLFVLQVEAGKQLELCSEFPSEKEVLLPLNSHFKVSKIIQDDAGKVQRLPLLGNYDVSGLVVYVLEQL
mmetsp:Transcript_29995/g.72245  ORF Transcript_29995/g.72245 Transcript_29995/m.72245 type:complete len:365 (+) Transcript_29995:63-1157(+)